MSLGHHLSNDNNNTLTEFPPFTSTPGLNYYTDKHRKMFLRSELQLTCFVILTLTNALLTLNQINGCDLPSW